VLANDPAIRVQGAGDGNYDFFSIRGFSVAASVFSLNGLYGVLPWNTLSPEMVEQFEVIRGPATTFTGAAPFDNPGGTVNIQPKRADDEPLTRITTTYDTGGQPGVLADIGRRFGDDNEWGVRVNGAYRDGDLARKHQSEDVALITIGADYQGDALRVSLDAGHQDYRTDGASFLFYIYEGTEVPDAPNVNDNVSPEWAFADSKDNWVATRAEYDMSDAVSLFGAVGARKHDSRILNPYSEIVDGNGDLYVYPYQEAYFADTNWSAESGIRFAFDTGPFDHQLIVSASGIDFDTGWQGSYSDGVVVPPGFDEYESNLFHPYYPPAPSLAGLPSHGQKQIENQLTSYAIVDTISLYDGKYQLTLGERLQNFDITRLYDEENPEYNDDEWSPSVGLLAMLTDDISVYGNYMTGLSQGPFAPVGTVNQNEQFSPDKTEQYEVGLKAQWRGLFTSLALFDIEQPAGLTDPITNIFSVDGKQRHRGVEWTFDGEVTPGVRLLGGANYIDAELERTEGGLLDGNQAPGVPEYTANIGGEVDIADTGVTLTGRMLYTDEAYIFGDNEQHIPDWTRFDAGARYVFTYGMPITLRLIATNVTGEDYWASAQGAGLTLGAPRTYFLSATIDF
jgi:iron complex outermembrane receptor protein